MFSRGYDHIQWHRSDPVIPNRSVWTSYPIISREDEMVLLGFFFSFFFVSRRTRTFRGNDFQLDNRKEETGDATVGGSSFMNFLLNVLLKHTKILIDFPNKG